MTCMLLPCLAVRGPRSEGRTKKTHVVWCRLFVVPSREVAFGQPARKLFLPIYAPRAKLYLVCEEFLDA